MNSVENDIKTLNCILNKLRVNGFKFVSYNNRILLVIKKNPAINSSYFSEFGEWFPFSCSLWTDIKHMITGNLFSQLLDAINESKQINSNGFHNCDYLGVNDAGIDFIKCVQNVTSMNELYLKLQLMGYDI